MSPGTLLLRARYHLFLFFSLPPTLPPSLFISVTHTVSLHLVSSSHSHSFFLSLSPHLSFFPSTTLSYLSHLLSPPLSFILDDCKFLTALSLPTLYLSLLSVFITHSPMSFAFKEIKKEKTGMSERERRERMRCEETKKRDQGKRKKAKRPMEILIPLLYSPHPSFSSPPHFLSFPHPAFFLIVPLSFLSSQY